MKLFISGWAGFKEALDVPEEWHFIVPFIDFDEEGILDFLTNKSGSTAIGWSTGGHIILKNLKFFSERFDEIIIVAGFKKFTDYVNPRVIKRMIQKMQTEPNTVLKDFLVNAGCKPVLPDKIYNNSLIEGLRFLLDSDVDVTQLIFPYNLILIHGEKDRIVSFQALHDLQKLSKVKAYVVDGEHWVGFKKIKRILEKIHS